MANNPRDHEREAVEAGISKLESAVKALSEAEEWLMSVDVIALADHTALREAEFNITEVLYRARAIAHRDWGVEGTSERKGRTS